ncbi:microfibril-associated glycoprotein 4-like isoform X2 [Anopheles moucheti]|uniref:microfibril-associated glycoprotein 4-like isoform X2 n=1 Tax=Anopheles moucheti TaxID=186751 RepID=UPI0022F108EE|nr:microfibril-associated glycoprotein 4-like isoform X2 [Anopheles moucheti]
MLKINLLCALALCCTIFRTQCAPTANTSSALHHGGFAFEMILTKLKLLEDRLYGNMVERSCREVPSSGIYTIQPEKPFKEPVSVLCDKEFLSGGWTVIQHRFNGSTNFYRNWKEYKNGFGNLDGEFWLGLDRIYQLTMSQPHELVVVLEDFEGNKTYAKYDQFEIGDETRKYEVAKLGGYTGTAGDSFGDTKGMKFSTFDKDHDTWETHCAVTLAGAWWYSNCILGKLEAEANMFIRWRLLSSDKLNNKSNLNGKYLRGKTEEFGTGMGWDTFRGQHYALKSSKMMIRPNNV